MKLHRPVDLDSFDDEFFSSRKIKIDETPAPEPEAPSQDKQAQPGNEAPVLNETDGESTDLLTEQETDSLPPVPPEIVEKLSKIKEFSSGVFHDLPDDDIKMPDNAVSQVTEEDALKSFPDFIFDTDKLDEAKQKDAEQEKEMSSLEKCKAESKLEIKNEREKIKARKQLEKTVQRPFKARRLLSFLLAVFILVGIVLSAFITVLSKTGNNPENMLNISNYSVCYIDGVSIKGAGSENTIALFGHEKVSGNRKILFRHNTGAYLEDVVAIGDGFCAVKLDLSVLPVENSDILGVMHYSLADKVGLYGLVANRLPLALLICAVYFAVVIALFCALIHRQNVKIKEYRENYQLVD